LACMELPPKKDRVIYSTAERAAKRGAKASASAWGWCWIKASDGTWAMYTSAGIAPRHYRPLGWPTPAKDRQITLTPGFTAFRCLQCGYVEHSLICHESSPTPTLCVCCMGDVAALHALALQEEWGIELGWRRPALGVVCKGLHEDDAGLSLTTTPSMRMANMRKRAR